MNRYKRREAAAWCAVAEAYACVESARRALLVGVPAGGLFGEGPLSADVALRRAGEYGDARRAQQRARVRALRVTDPQWCAVFDAPVHQRARWRHRTERGWGRGLIVCSCCLSPRERAVVAGDDGSRVQTFALGSPGMTGVECRYCARCGVQVGYGVTP
jgi:hypothetical protein